MQAQLRILGYHPMLAIECCGTFMHITGLGDLGSYNRDETTANEILHG
jgi:hypothetical protein